MNTDLLVRDLEPETKMALQTQAARNGRSMSAEARIILRDALTQNEDAQANAALIVDRFFPAELRLSDDEARLFDDAVNQIDGDLDPPDLR